MFFCVGILRRGELYNFEVSRHDEANLRKSFPVVFSRCYARKSHTSFLWPMFFVSKYITTTHIASTPGMVLMLSYERRRCRKVFSTRQISVFYLFTRACCIFRNCFYHAFFFLISIYNLHVNN